MPNCFSVCFLESFVSLIITLQKYLFESTCKTEVKEWLPRLPHYQRSGVPILTVERQAVVAKHGFIRPVLQTPDFIVRPTFPIDVTGIKKPQLTRAAGTDCGPTVAAFPFGHSSIQRRLDSMQLAHSNQSRRCDVCKKTPRLRPESDTGQILVFTRCPLMLMSRRLIFQVHDEFVEKKKETQGEKNAVVEHS
uniref:Tick transposon n=1 Tax=Rhipicephalus zambeziensis TaxID=60191 RepID=A0A224YEG4_9ACAR